MVLSLLKSKLDRRFVKRIDRGQSVIVGWFKGKYPILVVRTTDTLVRDRRRHTYFGVSEGIVKGRWVQSAWLIRRIKWELFIVDSHSDKHQAVKRLSEYAKVRSRHARSQGV